ncbi:MAG: hypothetical protein OEZ06_19040 [Myxococcales bacterium]|nr:hypothetical protein [Myxococcales bacterium]
MEIFLDKRSVRQIRQSASDAIEDGDTETLREDVMDAFDEEQIEEIERRIDGGDFYDFIGDTLDEWDGEDVDELFELLESHLADVSVELKFRGPGMDDDEEADGADDDDDDDDFDDDDDDGEMDESLALDDDGDDEL